MFPVKEPLLRQRVSQEIIDAYLADRAKSRFLQPDGSYLRAHQLTRKRRMLADEFNPLNQLPGLNAQEFLLALAEGKRASQTQVPAKLRPRRQMAAK